MKRWYLNGRSSRRSTHGGWTRPVTHMYTSICYLGYSHQSPNVLYIPGRSGILWTILGLQRRQKRKNDFVFQKNDDYDIGHNSSINNSIVWHHSAGNIKSVWTLMWISKWYYISGQSDFLVPLTLVENVKTVRVLIEGQTVLTLLDRVGPKYVATGRSLLL